MGICVRASICASVHRCLCFYVPVCSEVWRLWLRTRSCACVPRRKSTGSAADNKRDILLSSGEVYCGCKLGRCTQQAAITRVEPLVFVWRCLLWGAVPLRVDGCTLCVSRCVHSYADFDAAQAGSGMLDVSHAVCCILRVACCAARPALLQVGQAVRARWRKMASRAQIGFRPRAVAAWAACRAVSRHGIFFLNSG